MVIVLTAVWLAWRHEFSSAGFGLGLLGLFGGGLMLTTYLLVVSLQTRGDAAALLLGRARAARR